MDNCTRVTLAQNNVYVNSQLNCPSPFLNQPAQGQVTHCTRPSAGIEQSTTARASSLSWPFASHSASCTAPLAPRALLHRRNSLSAPDASVSARQPLMMLLKRTSSASGRDRCWRTEQMSLRYQTVAGGKWVRRTRRMQRYETCKGKGTSRRFRVACLFQSSITHEKPASPI